MHVHIFCTKYDLIDIQKRMSNIYATALGKKEQQVCKKELSYGLMIEKYT